MKYRIVKKNYETGVTTVILDTENYNTADYWLTHIRPIAQTLENPTWFVMETHEN
jgi:hypothetical protein